MDVKKSRINNYKSLVTGLLLVGFAIAHSIWPQRVSLDWPTVALVIVGVLLCFSRRAMALLPYLKRLKVGEAEIELQEKLSDLRANVEQIEEEVPHRRAHTSVDRIVDTTVESTILDLATKDKEAAVVRLAIELEKEMVLLCRKLGIEPQGTTWRELVNSLAGNKIIEPPLARALIEFRDVRNQVIHSGVRGPVQESMLTRTLDDGLQLLRLLKISAR